MSTDSKLHLLREGAVEKLARTMSLTDTPKQYLDAAAELLEDESNLLSLDWEFGTERPTLTYVRGAQGRAVTGRDISNAIALYQYLGTMTPVAASDRRLWSHLAHGPFADYQKQRWPLDDDKWASRVATRWQMRNPGRGPLVRHGISRLWWAANLTADSAKTHKLSHDNDDEYAYLRVLLSHEDAFLGIVDRDTGMVPNLLFAVLEHISSTEERGKELYVRKLMVEIVLVAGYSELAGLSVTEIDKILVGLGERIRAR